MFMLCLSMGLTVFGCGNADDKDDDSRVEKDLDDEDDEDDADDEEDEDEDEDDDDSDSKKKKDKKDKKEKKDKEDKDEADEEEDSDDKKDEADNKADEEKPKKDVKKSSETLSDDVYDFQISLSGTVVSFPIAFSEFESYGFTCTDDSSQSIPSGSYGMFYFKNADGDRVMGYVMNFGINAAAAEDCYITGVQVDKFDYKTGEAAAAAGMTINESTRDEVEAAFGDPSDAYESDSYPNITYKIDYYEYVKFTFDAANDDVLYKIEVKNFVEPEGFDPGEVDTTSIPAITAAYKAPTEMSDDLLDYVVEFDGDLYQLPCPVSEFLNNGWEYNDSKTDATVEGSGSGWVTLRKNNKEFRTLALNYDENATIPDNCFVTSIGASTFNNSSAPDVKLNNAADIKVGDKVEDVEKKLKGYDYKKEESSYVSFQVSDSRSLTYHYEISCFDGVVSSINIQYNPRKADFRKEMGVDK